MDAAFVQSSTCAPFSRIAMPAALCVNGRAAVPIVPCATRFRRTVPFSAFPTNGAPPYFPVADGSNPMSLIFRFRIVPPVTSLKSPAYVRGVNVRFEIVKSPPS